MEVCTKYIIGVLLILSVLTVSSMADEYEDDHITDVGTGDSGPSIGGGGVVTCEPSTNVVNIERYKQNMLKDSVYIHTFSNQGFGIYAISFIGQEDENDVALRAEYLNDSSKCRNVTSDIPGNVYKNVNVWVGTPMIRDVIINFEVEKSWLQNSGISSQNIGMFLWNKKEGIWKMLETKVIEDDDTYVYFESKANNLAQFAISGLTPELMSEIANNPELKETPIISIATGSSNNIKTITGIFMTMIIGIIVAYFIAKKKMLKEEK